jgi:hypothetical protein
MTPLLKPEEPIISLILDLHERNSDEDPGHDDQVPTSGKLLNGTDANIVTQAVLR